MTVRGLLWSLPRYYYKGLSPNQQSFGTPGQTKVSGDRQREPTNEICCLAAECTVTFKKKLVTCVRIRDYTVCMYEQSNAHKNKIV